MALLSFLAASSAASAQGLGNSPYSRLGLGDFSPNTGGVRQQGMGGVGLAAPNAVQVNDLNPALIYYINRTTYEVAGTGQVKTLSNGSTSQRTGSGSLGYLSFAVPISRRWAVAASLRPLTTVDYKSTQTGSVAGDPTAVVYNQFSGSGGLTEVALSQGVRLFKGMTVGLTSSYVFGAIDRSTTALLVPAQLQATESLRQAATTDHVQYNDFLFRVAGHYRHSLGKKLNANVAGVYSFETKLDGTRSQQQDEQDANGVSVLATGPVELATVSGTTTLPSSWQAGFSLDNNKNWSLNADVSAQQWSKFRDFGTTGTTAVPLYNTWRVGVGGEIAPDPSAVDGYFKRVAYRAGVGLATLPYRPGGQTLYDRSVSWGFSFPFPTASPLDATTLNLGFTYGQRGNTDKVTFGGVDQTNIKESYLKLNIGVSLNNRWFLKRRIE
ncbi:hypothetical protein [Hymenobacter sp. CRA2]|uniref:hypothetical protein n=1 Tax=Hymenobacter sp. CRA2 TaxID=1955620 RepID=UPI00111690DE|nr:hypothetical protein [Hymenobacter sp. CRA2]